MKYCMWILLCTTTLSAEAIPETLTMGPMQESLYKVASVLKSQQPMQVNPNDGMDSSKGGDSEATSTAKEPLKPKPAHKLPEVSTVPTPSESAAKLQVNPPLGSTGVGDSESTAKEPLKPKTAHKLSEVPTLPDSPSKTAKEPFKSEKIDVPPKAPDSASKQQINPPLDSTMPIPKPLPLPKPTVTLPAVLTLVEAAKAKAKELYGKEFGFLGATDRVVKTKDGQRFLYINIRGDGNCGFYASGLDRATFVKTIGELVNQNHDQYEGFLNERTALVEDITNVMLTDDKTDIVARVQKLVDKADNGGTVAPALKLLTNFNTEMKTYRTELFTDARNSLIKSLQTLEGLSAVKSNNQLKTQIQEFIDILTTASVEAFNVTDQFNALVEALTKATIEVTQTRRCFSELVTVCRYDDVFLFEKAKGRLIGTIQNLTTLSAHEAFLTALKQELTASGLSAGDFDTKEKLLKSVGNVFSQNRGSNTWIPGGLLAPIMKKLKKEYNIWARDGLEFIQLFSTSSSKRGLPAKGQNVRNLFFTGGHYDMLIPLDE